MKWFIYMLQCSDDTIYTGYTNDVDKRVEKHNKGKGAKYTKGRRPVTLVYYEQHPSKSSAMKREYAIKQLTKDEKIKLMFPIDKEVIR
jgi:putative endonuclease